MITVTYAENKFEISIRPEKKQKNQALIKNGSRKQNISLKH